MNLYNETTDDLTRYNKTWNDVVWVGSSDGKYIYDKNTLESLFDIEYDSGYGRNYICTDLVICGTDWWMERGEYDGSEWWNFCTIPQVNPNSTICKVAPLSRDFNELYEDITV